MLPHIIGRQKVKDLPTQIISGRRAEKFFQSVYLGELTNELQCGIVTEFRAL